MALVSKSIPNLINGVSQQPPALRLPTQGEAQENGLSDVVDGLKKRPPTKFLNKLVKCKSTWTASTASTTTGDLTTANTESYDLSSAFIHTYKRSGDEQYTVVILPHATTPTVLVYDIAGNLRYESGKSSWLADGSTIVYSVSGTPTYTNSDDTSYLVGLSSTALNSEDIAATSVADATFILNKKKTVAMDDDTISPSSSGYSALVYLKSVNYGRTYNVNLTTKTSGSTVSINSGNVTTLNSNQNPSDNSYSSTGIIYNENLKVSSVVGSLRQGLATNSASSFSGGGQQAFPTINTGWIPAEDEYYYWQAGYASQDFSPLVEITVSAAAFSSTPEDMVITFGGTGIPYKANRVNGWKYLDVAARKIGLPVSVYVQTDFERGYGGDDDEAVYQRPAGTVTNLTNVSTADFLIEPIAYDEEPYFTIHSPNQGVLKDFQINATDDDGGINLRVFKDNAKSFTDLPNQCIDGFRLGVVGDNNKKEDNFYVVYEGGAGSGTWKETVAYDLKNYYDLTTMPHTLKQKDDLRFCFGQGEDQDGKTWAFRKAGDESTNPTPSFVGNTINDIFFHRNRLGIISGENVIFSETSNFFNFFRTTVRTLLDSDPIDVAVSQNEVSELKSALPIQDSLLLFSELNQFTLSASQLLTPAEVTIDQSTKFECDLSTPPVGAGNSVFFNTVGGNFAGVREYYTDGETEIKDATLITSHVPEYLSGNVRSMAASTNEDMLICLTSSVKSEAYVYKWYNSNNERLQSSWSKWTFDKNVADITFNNSDLYITFEDGSYEKMNLRTSTQDITFSNQGIAEVITGLSGYGANTSIDALAQVDGTLCAMTVNTASNKVEFLTTLDGLDKLVVNDKDLLVTDATLVLGDAGYGWKTYTWNNVTSLSGNSAFFTNLASPASVSIYAHFTTGVLFEAKAHDVLLDHRVKIQASTSAAAAYTSTNFDDAATLYGWGNNTQFITYKGEILGTGATQTKDKVIAAINGQSHIENNVTVGSYVYAGEPYTFKYQLSEQVFEPAQGDSTKLARFQLRNMSFNFNDTGTFNVSVDSTGRNTVNHKFTGRLLGQADNLLGYSAVVTDDTFKVGVQSQASETDITITNDTHLPCVFQSAEYEGWVTLRNQRL